MGEHGKFLAFAGRHQVFPLELQYLTPLGAHETRWVRTRSPLEKETPACAALRKAQATLPESARNRRDIRNTGVRFMAEDRCLVGLLLVG